MSIRRASTTQLDPPANDLRPWSDLPLDIIDLIAAELPLPDRVRFAAVCKSWSSTSASLDLTDSRPWPVLMCLPKATGDVQLYYFFDPFGRRVYDTDDQLSSINGGLTLRSSKDGWVLISDEDDAIYFFNPFTGEDEDIFELPMVDKFPSRFSGISFSSPPTSSDCVVLGIECNDFFDGGIQVFWWRHGDPDWTYKSYTNNLPFCVAKNNPVFHGGLFYFLGKYGNLGVFDPKEETWTVLDKPKPSHPMRIIGTSNCKVSTKISQNRSKQECYLVESSKGEMLSVFSYNDGEKILVSRLNESKMAWEKVKDLGDDALFVDKRASLSVVAPSRGARNRIYFPRFSDGDNKEGVYYSLESKKYCANSMNFVEQRADCVWIMPSKA